MPDRWVRHGQRPTRQEGHAPRPSSNEKTGRINGGTLNLNHSSADTVFALYVDGVQKPAGTYSSGNSSFITGTGPAATLFRHRRKSKPSARLMDSSVKRVFVQGTANSAPLLPWSANDWRETASHLQ
jgi:hypothetical protein